MTALIEEKIVQGDSLNWTETETDYPASDSWVVYYVLVNETSRIAFNSTADGDFHLFDITTATTSAWKAGEYNYQRYVSDSTDRVTLDQGSVVIEKDFTTASDRRSHAKKVLDAIEAVIEDRASIDQQEYTINGRSLKRMTLDDLLKLRGYYKSVVRKEAGKSSTIQVRFT
jgi:hypothetical protein